MKCPSCGIENPEDSKYCRKCATALPGREASFTRTLIKGPAEFATRTIIAGHYKIDRILGRGGMGVVYLADDTRLKRPVALKFLPPGLALDEDIRKRFIIEAQAAAALSHPNICTIYEVDDQAERTFISMEYIEGENLREKASKDPFAFDHILDIALQICAGLDEAHKKGIVHRDVKSANIMLTAKGQAKIMDFGLAKVAGTAMITIEGSTMGTVAYMSPEQAKGEAVDARTDIWSLGVVLYELVSGKLPFSGDLESAIIHNIIHEEPKPLKAIVPKVPEGFERIVKRALKKKVDDRYGSAAEMLADLRKLRVALEKEKASVFNPRSFLRVIRKPLVAVPSALVLIGLGFVIFSILNRQAKIRWAERVAIPEIERLLTLSDFKALFNLALRAEKYIPQSQRLAQLWPLAAGSLSIETEPAGADVYIKDYTDRQDSWEYFGRSPVVNRRSYQGYRHWKIEKDGFETAEGALYIRSGHARELKTKLDKKGEIPPGMVRVQGGTFSTLMSGLSYLKSVELKDYFLDKYEVTNRQYKEFLEGGGYKNKEYWKNEFIKNGRAIPWEEGMKDFVDKTGRPGPASWEFGDYPQGQSDHPVSGVSWYEAAAFAEFAGKRLPTFYHWNHASGDYDVDTGFMIPLSNLAGRGLASVGSFQSLGPFGNYDMAGNVKEWCWNETEGKRFILGGAWNEAQVRYDEPERYFPFLRADNFGFRCMKSLPGQDAPPETAGPLEVIPPPDFSKLKPCSEESFEIFRRLYAYTRTDLAAKVESTQDWSEYTVLEKVSFDDAYGEERVVAYLFIPRKGEPPFQTVIYFPGTGAWRLDSVFDYGTVKNREVELFTKNGRAFVFPVFKGTFERRTKPIEKVTTQYLRDDMIRWYRDMARCLDYLETRPEFDKSKYAYEGLSEGAWVGPLFAALDTRFKAAIFLSGGIWRQEYEPERYVPERDMINFAPRVKIPVLMQDGKYGYQFPLETSVKVLYNLLGTPEKDKHLLLYETGHYVWLLNEYRKDMFDFLDKYLGPAK
jgi:serine/threonine protein kinase/formylglycine-generating enzyme required for sulfatase activity/dienelactone hydrolase